MIADPELSILIVSFNSRELTLHCLRALFAEDGGGEDARIILWENASADGSADAIAEQFGDCLRLVSSPENVGFARANNEAAKMAKGEWLLLLNPDTEVRPGAIKALLDFGKANPDGGIYGGRTVFPDGSLNIASC